MASDLSKFIEDGLCSTLNALLSKEATLKETTKVHEKDLADIQTLQVDSTFEFTNITSTLSFIIPAWSASFIFNSMLGDTSDPVDVLDADIADALNEFISNVSGGLTTIINGSDLEDLGNSKFTTSMEGIIEKNQITDFENMYRFSIDLDGVEVTIFILFDDVIVPFVETISKSTLTEHIEKEPEVEEVKDEEAKEVESKEIVTPQKEELTNSEVQNTEESKPDVDTEDDESTDDVELTDDEKKANKLKKIIIGVAALIGITMISGIAMYFLGMFEPEPIEVVEVNTTISKDNIEVVKYNNKNNINFHTSKINVNRLNARLEALSKFDILSEDELKQQKIEQSKRLEELKKEDELEAFAKLNKEEQITVIDTNTTNINNQTTDLRFILVHSLKYKLFKNLILKSNTKKARISICKDTTGRTSVYIGPFENESSQLNMFDLIKEEKLKLKMSTINISKEEFNKRCKF